MQGPDRARAVGTLCWEGHFRDGRAPLACVVGEDWLLERDASGALGFVLWLNTMHHVLEHSSVQRLTL
ncbi:hypothetical protein DLJ53_31825 [Acuticoccus sediminis]|uniref:Uncharacterized protein n=1 Tax=Acuticoccus sediminis TaxID=2184697 RepID=A0A8B2NH01_9HYPH|nr:hypothetical protein [Acuticoccus sediminis]RAH96508.1 hypothetical protein DLJ53_31825 [Acuticoccus sediminis]